MTSGGEGSFRAPAEESLLPHLGTYRRTLPVRFARLEETVLDVERLPRVHGESYAWVKCESATSLEIMASYPEIPTRTLPALRPKRSSSFLLLQSTVSCWS